MTVDPERLRQTSRHNALVNPGAAYQLREAADEIERLVAEVEQSHTEIDRMRALLDQATQSANSTVRALVAADAREATLRALLTEARDVLRGSATFAQVGEHLELIEGWESESDAVLTTKVVAALAVWKSLADSLSGRIDAALGGGAPCATCDGTGITDIDCHPDNETPCPACNGTGNAIVNSDPLAQLLASRDRDLINVTPDVHMMLLAEEVAWMRAHRDELLAALGGEKYPLQLIEDTTGTTIWRFGEDA